MTVYVISFMQHVTCLKFILLPNAADQGSFRRFENEKNKTKKFEQIPTKKRIERKAT